MTKKIDMLRIAQLREMTGIGMMDCKRALEDTDGNMEKALELLKKKGIAVAEKRAEKQAMQGVVHAYIHPGSKIGVLLELNCETDFVARTDEFKGLANDLCLHIAAIKPLYVRQEDIDAKFVEHQKETFRAELSGSGKPEKVLEQIIKGKLEKFYDEVCLLQQAFVKDDQKTITQVLTDMMAKTGEKIQVRRFSRFEIGL